MITALSVRRRLARSAAVTATAAGMALVLTGSATASVPSRVPAPRKLPTLFANVRSYARPTMHSAVKGRLGAAGTTTRVACWTSGMFYKDSVIWYRITDPITGYVASFNLQAHFSPAAHVARCPTPEFRQTYYSLAADLRIRTGPSTATSIISKLAAIGSPVAVSCYVRGTRIYSDPVWYATLSPADGFVSGRFLNTGTDPAIGVPHC